MGGGPERAAFALEHDIHKQLDKHSLDNCVRGAAVQAVAADGMADSPAPTTTVPKRMQSMTVLPARIQAMLLDSSSEEEEEDSASCASGSTSELSAHMSTARCPHGAGNTSASATLATLPATVEAVAASGFDAAPLIRPASREQAAWSNSLSGASAPQGRSISTLAAAPTHLPSAHASAGGASDSSSAAVGHAALLLHPYHSRGLEEQEEEGEARLYDPGVYEDDGMEEEHEAFLEEEVREEEEEEDGLGVALEMAGAMEHDMAHVQHVQLPWSHRRSDSAGKPPSVAAVAAVPQQPAPRAPAVRQAAMHTGHAALDPSGSISFSDGDMCGADGQSVVVPHAVVHADSDGTGGASSHGAAGVEEDEDDKEGLGAEMEEEEYSDSFDEEVVTGNTGHPYSTGGSADDGGSGLAVDGEDYEEGIYGVGGEEGDGAWPGGTSPVDEASEGSLSSGDSALAGAYVAPSGLPHSTGGSGGGGSRSGSSGGALVLSGGASGTIRGPNKRTSAHSSASSGWASTYSCEVYEEDEERARVAALHGTGHTSGETASASSGSSGSDGGASQRASSQSGAQCTVANVRHVSTGGASVGGGAPTAAHSSIGIRRLSEVLAQAEAVLAADAAAGPASAGAATHPEPVERSAWPSGHTGARATMGSEGAAGKRKRIIQRASSGGGSSSGGGRAPSGTRSHPGGEHDEQQQGAVATAAVTVAPLAPVTPAKQELVLQPAQVATGAGASGEESAQLWSPDTGSEDEGMGVEMAAEREVVAVHGSMAHPQALPFTLHAAVQEEGQVNISIPVSVPRHTAVTASQCGSQAGSSDILLLSRHSSDAGRSGSGSMGGTATALLPDMGGVPPPPPARAASSSMRGTPGRRGSRRMSQASGQPRGDSLFSALEAELAEIERMYVAADEQPDVPAAEVPGLTSAGGVGAGQVQPAVAVSGIDSTATHGAAPGQQQAVTRSPGRRTSTDAAVDAAAAIAAAALASPRGDIALAHASSFHAVRATVCEAQAMCLVLPDTSLGGCGAGGGALPVLSRPVGAHSASCPGGVPAAGPAGAQLATPTRGSRSRRPSAPPSPSLAQLLSEAFNEEDEAAVRAEPDAAPEASGATPSVGVGAAAAVAMALGGAAAPSPQHPVMRSLQGLLDEAGAAPADTHLAHPQPTSERSAGEVAAAAANTHAGGRREVQDAKPATSSGGDGGIGNRAVLLQQLDTVQSELQALLYRTRSLHASDRGGDDAAPAPHAPTRAEVPTAATSVTDSSVQEAAGSQASAGAQAQLRATRSAGGRQGAAALVAAAIMSHGGYSSASSMRSTSQTQEEEGLPSGTDAHVVHQQPPDPATLLQPELFLTISRTGSLGSSGSSGANGSRLGGAAEAAAAAALQGEQLPCADGEEGVVEGEADTVTTQLLEQQAALLVAALSTRTSGAGAAKARQQPAAAVVQVKGVDGTDAAATCATSVILRTNVTSSQHAASIDTAASMLDTVLTLITPGSGQHVEAPASAATPSAPQARGALPFQAARAAPAATRHSLLGTAEGAATTAGSAAAAWAGAAAAAAERPAQVKAGAAHTLLPQPPVAGRPPTSASAAPSPAGGRRYGRPASPQQPAGATASSWVVDGVEVGIRATPSKASRTTRTILAGLASPKPPSSALPLPSNTTTAPHSHVLSTSPLANPLRHSTTRIHALQHTHTHTSRWAAVGGAHGGVRASLQGLLPFQSGNTSLLGAGLASAPNTPARTRSLGSSGSSGILASAPHPAAPSVWGPNTWGTARPGAQRELWPHTLGAAMGALGGPERPPSPLRTLPPSPGPTNIAPFVPRLTEPMLAIPVAVPMLPHLDQGQYDQKYYDAMLDRSYDLLQRLHWQQLCAEQRSQAEEADAAVALLLAPGNGLDTRMSQPVAAHEAAELSELHRLVRMRTVLTPLERVRLWARVEVLLASRLPPAPPAPGSPRAMASMAAEAAAMAAATPSRQPRYTVASAATTHAKAVTGLQPTNPTAALAALAVPHYRAGTSSGGSPTTPRRQHNSTGAAAAAAGYGVQVEEDRAEEAAALVGHTLERVHRAVAPNATLAHAMDLDWQQLREAQTRAASHSPGRSTLGSARREY